MSELEDLKKQRRELDARIKELEDRTITFGRVKFGFQYPQYYLAYKYKARDGSERYQKLVVADDEKAVIESIPSIIKDLEGLRELYKGREQENGNSDQLSVRSSRGWQKMMRDAAAMERYRERQEHE